MSLFRPERADGRDSKSSETRDQSLRRAERYYIRVFLGGLAGLVLFVLCCWSGYQAYSRWQEHQYMHQAHVALDQGNLQWAGLAAQRAYSWRPESADACRTLAEIAERQMNAQAIDWRRRAADLQPNSVPDQVALVETALRFSRTQIATAALARVPKAQQADPAYQSAAAHVALTEGRWDDAARNLEEAARLSPNNPQRQLELADFDLRAKDEARRTVGRGLANRLQDIPEAHVAAIGLLLSDALREKNNGRAAALAKELAGVTTAPFNSRLNALSALQALNGPDYVTVLGQMQSEARDSVQKAAALINWMNQHNLALLAINWCKELPPTVVDTLAVRAAQADSLVMMHDWASLGTMLKSGTWSSAESLRLALQSKVDYENGDQGASDKNWATAVKKAASDTANLELLERLASQWQWSDRTASILWLLADQPRTQVAALQALYRHYTTARDSSGLYRTFVRLAKVSPNDRTVQNNLLQLSLLLNLDSAGAESKARQLLAADPKNVAFASTYAFALYQAGKDAAAVQVMQQFSPEQLKEPSIAVYYGIVLARAGNPIEAARYLELGKSASLLPEEENLVAQARKEIAQR